MPNRMRRSGRIRRVRNAEAIGFGSVVTALPIIVSAAAEGSPLLEQYPVLKLILVLVVCAVFVAVLVIFVFAVAVGMKNPDKDDERPPRPPYHDRRRHGGDWPRDAYFSRTGRVHPQGRPCDDEEEDEEEDEEDHHDQ